MKELQQDLEEARHGREDLTISARDAERKLKAMEQEHMQLQEVLTKSSTWTSNCYVQNMSQIHVCMMDISNNVLLVHGCWRMPVDKLAVWLLSSVKAM